MSEIRAIETRYKGYRFRSRLEARWAVFFDALEIEYQYEPQGFEKQTNPCSFEGTEEEVDAHKCGKECLGESTRYLPDFYLPKTKTWVEVKGTDEAMKADASRLEEILDFGSPLPGFDDSDDCRPYLGAPGLLILGEVPYVEFGVVFHPMIRHHKGLVWRWAVFLPKSIRVLGDDDFLSSLFLREVPEWSTKAIFVSTPRAWNKVTDGYRSARSARFEHGETPR